MTIIVENDASNSNTGIHVTIVAVDGLPSSL